MDIGLILPLPLSTRGYLIYQVFGSVLVNAAINFGFAWPMRHAASVPVLGGSGSVAFDTCLTAVLLSALTVVTGSWFVKRDMQRGVVRPLARSPRDYPLLRPFPTATLPRALLFGAMFSAISAPLALGILALLGVDAMTFQQFLVFKLVFAIVLGAVVTPWNAAVVLSAGGGAHAA